MKLVIIDDDSKFAKLMKDDLLIHFSDYDEDVEIDIIDDHFSNLINIKQYLFYFIDIDLKEINGYEIWQDKLERARKTVISFLFRHVMI